MGRMLPMKVRAIPTPTHGNQKAIHVSADCSRMKAKIKHASRTKPPMIWSGFSFFMDAAMELGGRLRRDQRAVVEEPAEGT